MLAAMSFRSPAPLHWLAATALIAAALLTTSGCSNKPSKEEEEAARNTFACQLRGERVVLRFDAGEARLLRPGGERVVLYQLPTASGVRFSNGTMEPYAVPKAS